MYVGEGNVITHYKKIGTYCIHRIGGYIILVSVKGYYDGEQIVIDEDDRKNLNISDEVIITILDRI